MSMVNEKRVDEALEDLHDGQPVDAVLPGLNSFEIWRMVERLEQSRSALQQNNEKMRRALVDLKWTLDADGRFSTAAIDEALR